MLESTPLQPLHPERCGCESSFEQEQGRPSCSEWLDLLIIMFVRIINFILNQR
jgi:hypothetical protein